MHSNKFLIAAAMCAGVLEAQMSGPFVIDPSSGPGVFHSFTEAVNALFVNGVNGPVDVFVFPGTYNESVLVPPISGTSAVNVVTFRAIAGPGTVSIAGGAGDTFALLAVSFLHSRSLVWDGIDFAGGPGFAISGTGYCEDIEVRNCSFAPNQRNNSAGEFRHALIVADLRGGEIGWRIHHNRMTIPNRLSRTAYGIYVQQGGNWEIHHNSIDLNGCSHGIYLINDNTRLDSIYDNLIFGSLASNTGSSASSVSAISVDVSNFNNDIAHNTFVVTIPTTGSIISSAGFGTNLNRMYGNVFVLLAGGTCISSDTYNSPPQYIFLSDGNDFWAPAGEIGRLGSSNPGFTTLAAWQAASGRDLNSINADPLLVNTSVLPFDLHPLPASPVKNAATNTPAIVTTDFDGRLRDATPDIGAYELSGFAFYGLGCAGTGGLVPAIGNTGTIAIGSANFAVTVSQANANSVAILLAGFSRTVFNSVPLPFDIGGGCSVQAAPDLTFLAFTDPGGAGSFTTGIPNNPLLIGLSVFFQWGVVDPNSGSSLGATVSNAGALQL